MNTNWSLPFMLWFYFRNMVPKFFYKNSFKQVSYGDRQLSRFLLHQNHQSYSYILYFFKRVLKYGTRHAFSELIRFCFSCVKHLFINFPMRFEYHFGRKEIRFCLIGDCLYIRRRFAYIYYYSIMCIYCILLAVSIWYLNNIIIHIMDCI